MEGLATFEVLNSLLLVKAVLALLAVLIFAYYKVHYDRAKRHLAIHVFYAKWRAVRHAVLLGLSSIGFAAGFSLELFGAQLGLPVPLASFLPSVLEIGSLFCILAVFFQLALEDVPHFSHIAESHHHRHHAHEAPLQPPKPAKKSRLKKGKKR